MPGPGGACLLLALAAFATFFADVAFGAMRMQGFLGDVAEMLMLLAAAVFFVAGVLYLEAAENKKDL